MITKFINKLSENSEFAVVIGILVVLGMLVIPLPTELLDVLIVINITVSVTLLMVVIYILDPLNLSSFPSILLLIALFRVGITISTTRLILIQADAGHMVETFGNFVAGGNLVVGFIVFIIITIVNFIVITKGSERVAEVGARFSLDGLPGKQMAVDADLRAGFINGEQAIAKRKHLELESRFHASMDGALKFVKGDNIASIIVIGVNLIGGIIVGVFMHNFEVNHAVKVYSILTIGDGLVQIVPSLLVSITAGLLVTKVTDIDDKDPINLGQAVVNQILDIPKALFATSGIMVVFAFVPGMPVPVFIGMFLLLAITGVVINIRKKITKNEGKPGAATEAPKMLGEDSGKAEDLPVLDTWKLYPLMLNVSTSFKGSGFIDKIKKSLTLVQKNLKVDLGVEVPQIFMRYDENQPKDTFQVLIQEVPTSTGVIVRNSILLIDNQDNLPMYGIKKYQENFANIGDKLKGFWIDESYTQMCKESNLVFLTVEEFLVRHLSFEIKQHISEFLGMQEVKNMLDKMPEFQDLIKELLRMLPLNKITEILQRLIGEDISIRNFKVILDAILEWAQREKDIILITEYVRAALGRYIAYKFSNGKNVLPCILISSDLEDAVRDSIRHTATGSYLALDPSIGMRMVENMKEIISRYKAIQIKPIVLVTMDIRRYVRTTIEKDLPFLHVLSFQELEGHAEFENLGIVDV
jgi:type III secretion protein V